MTNGYLVIAFAERQLDIRWLDKGATSGCLWMKVTGAKVAIPANRHPLNGIRIFLELHWKIQIQALVVYF